jgi:hypothetical protein
MLGGSVGRAAEFSRRIPGKELNVTAKLLQKRAGRTRQGCRRRSRQGMMERRGVTALKETRLWLSSQCCSKRDRIECIEKGGAGDMRQQGCGSTCKCAPTLLFVGRGSDVVLQ